MKLILISYYPSDPTRFTCFFSLSLLICTFFLSPSFVSVLSILYLVSLCGHCSLVFQY